MNHHVYERMPAGAAADLPAGGFHSGAPTRFWRGKRYVPVRVKFTLTVALALAWGIASYLMAQHWIAELSLVTGSVLAHLIILGIAILPGFMNAFLVVGLMLDRRPQTLDEMHEISGVGDRKLAAYGDAFLDVLQDHFRRNNAA